MRNRVFKALVDEMPTSRLTVITVRNEVNLAGAIYPITNQGRTSLRALIEGKAVSLSKCSDELRVVIFVDVMLLLCVELVKLIFVVHVGFLDITYADNRTRHHTLHVQRWQI